MEKIAFAILGCGSRGIGTYASASKKIPNDMDIVALADVDSKKVQKAAAEYHVAKEKCFPSAEALLKEDKLADALIIATLDRDHVRYAIEAMKKGYAILLEKPISPLQGECREIEKAYQKYHTPVVVCHVLRYTNFYRNLKKIIDSGVLGRLMGIQAIENVSYWHMAHSFVRGNWNDAQKTSPMILQKCCHDMDLFVWLTGKKAIDVSSFGTLSYFKKENAPKGATQRCTDACPIVDCPFDARKIYLENEITGFKRGNSDWPVDVVTLNPTEESILKALKNGPYGRCVYTCDNNVVDHQIVNIKMEGDILVSFTMTAFTKNCHRFIKVMGSEGEAYGDTEENILHVEPFSKPSYSIDTTIGQTDFSGHGGGDVEMIKDFISYLRTGVLPKGLTTLTDSLESHYICFAAEASREKNGTLIHVEDLR